MDKIDWKPFLKAAFERNPVCLDGLNGKSAQQVYELLQEMPDNSIYDDVRLAQPDEVWNFRRGDGVEKAILLADFIKHNDEPKWLMLIVEKNSVLLESDDMKFIFKSQKKLNFKKDLLKELIPV